MKTKMKDVEAASMELSLEERAELAGRLLLSLDEPTESELERLWLDEAERRLTEFRAGKQGTKPAEEVFRRAISELS
jgi:putative addiction module component (TIGR02574 family)